MKKNYISPTINIELFNIAATILEGSYHNPEGIGGSTTPPKTDEDDFFGGAPIRGGYSASNARDEMVGGWRRGGLW